MINVKPVLDQCTQLFTKLCESESLSKELEDALLDVGQAFDKIWDLKDKGTMDIRNETVAAQVFLELTRVMAKLCERSLKIASAIFNDGFLRRIANDLNDWPTSFKSKLLDDKSIILHLSLNYLRIVALIARFEEINYDVVSEARGLNFPDILQTILEVRCELNYFCTSTIVQYVRR